MTKLNPPHVRIPGLVSLGSAAVRHLLKISMLPARTDESVVLPARLVIRASTGPAPA